MSKSTYLRIGAQSPITLVFIYPGVLGLLLFLAVLQSTIFDTHNYTIHLPTCLILLGYVHDMLYCFRQFIFPSTI